MAKPGLEEGVQVQRGVQSDCGRVESAGGSGGTGCGEELDIHPFMLSLWRKQVREGKIVANKPKVTDEKLSAELRELRKMKKDYERLKEEHDILKKSIRFISERRQKSSSSSKRIGK